jgi:hypothetical protein
MVDSILSAPDSIQSAVDSIETSTIGVEGSPVDRRQEPDEGTVEQRPLDVVYLESKTVETLCQRITLAAPHMVQTFITDRQWWHENSFKPGIQVTSLVKLWGQLRC